MSKKYIDMPTRIFLLIMWGLIGCVNTQEKLPLHLLEYEKDISVRDLVNAGFVKDGGWYVSGDDDMLVVYSILKDSSELMARKYVTIKNVSTFSKADSLIRNYGGEALIWIDVYKYDSIFLRKSAFVRSTKTGQIFYCEYNSDVACLSFFYDLPAGSEQNNRWPINFGNVKAAIDPEMRIERNTK